MLHWCLYYSFQDCLSLCLTCRTFPLFPIDCRCCSYIDYNQRKIRLIPSLFSLKFGTTLFLDAGTSFWDMFTTWNVSIRLQLIILAEHMNIDSDQTNRYSFIFFFICSATHREYSCNELLDQKSFLLSSGCSFLFSSCLYLPLDSLWHIFYKYFVTSFTILFGKYFLQYDTKLIWLNSNLRFCNVCTQNWSITSFSPYAVGEEKKKILHFYCYYSLLGETWIAAFKVW